MQIGSPFGGIIYVTTGEVVGEVTLRFDKAYRHAVVDVARPEVWEATKASTAPWAEIVMRDIIFTVPRSFLPSIRDFEKASEVYDALIQGLLSYFSSEIVRPFRIVFDVELVNDNPVCGYPLIFPVEACDDLLTRLATPTFTLFNAAMLIGIVSIREGFFDSKAETVLGTVAAAVIFGKLFPNFDAEEMPEISLPPLFHELWDIQSRYDATLIPRALAVLQKAAYIPGQSNDEAWAEFVRQLCALGKRDFTMLLERSKPIFLSPCSSSEKLPPYTFFATS
jgi:hypothetical protein